MQRLQSQRLETEAGGSGGQCTTGHPVLRKKHKRVRQNGCWISLGLGVVRPWGLSPSTHNSGVVVHACNPGTQEAKTEESKVQGHAQLNIEVKASLGYIQA